MKSVIEDVTDIPREEIKIWVEALRSGEYSQCKGVLEKYNGHCCLGVACEIFIPDSKKRLDKGGRLIGSLPASQSDAPRWLKIISDDFARRTRISTYYGGANDTSLTKLNDYEELSFDEIADCLEAVYLLKVL